MSEKEVSPVLSAVNNASKPGNSRDKQCVLDRVLSVLDGVNDIDSAINKVAEACAFQNPSEFERAQIIDELCKRFNQVGKKTSLAKTLKSSVNRIKEQRFKRKSVGFGSIDITEPVPTDSFPDVYLKDGEIKLKTTAENVEHLLFGYGVTAEYDVITKKENLIFPNGYLTNQTDLADEAGVQTIRSMAARSGLNMGVVEFLPILLDRNPRNRVIEWITSKPHDGIDRITMLAETIETPENMFDLWPVILKLWLLQCVAAADGAESSPRKDAIAKYESVLVFVGGQGLSKSSWLAKLVPGELCQYFKEGLHLKVGNRDSEKAAISLWIGELGEVDATFRKSDIALIKAFLSRLHDTMRLSYARRECRFKRRTSFAASVNSFRFLTDETGSRRFWPVVVESINLQHGIDMQQLWRQVWELYINGEQWWPTPSVEKALKDVQVQHTEVDPVEDALLSVFDLDPKKSEAAYEPGFYSCKELVAAVGLDLTKANLNRAAEVLREREFDRKTIGGKRGFHLLKNTA